jgi:hypothetical protein
MTKSRQPCVHHSLHALEEPVGHERTAISLDQKLENEA